MNTKLGRIVNYLKWLPSIKLLNPLIRWFCKITWKTKTIIYSLLKWLWPPNLAGRWPALRGSCCPVTWTFNYVVLFDYMSTCRRPMDLKPGCWLTVKGFYPYNQMTLWSYDQREVTWQFEKIIFPISQDLWSLNLAGQWLMEGVVARKCLSRQQFLVFTEHSKT